jgi:intracellular sulfur oxidation DsrE/DsrF family protein
LPSFPKPSENKKWNNLAPLGILNKRAIIITAQNFISMSTKEAFNMKKAGTNLIFSIITGFIFLVATPVFAGNYSKQKVVYHINYDAPKQQAGALRNIQNHINAVGAENMDIKVVLHGNGLALLVNPESLVKLPKFKHANATEQMASTIDGLKNQGVTFNVCANTVKGRNVDVENDLYGVSQVDIVPSGVAELAHLQMQGYTYIKP